MMSDEKKKENLSAEEVYNRLINSMFGGDPKDRLSLRDKMIKKAEELDKGYIAKSTPVQTTIHDSYGGVNGYGNTITYSGSDDKIASFTNYGFDNDTMNYPLWTVLYNDSWVFRRAIDKPANDEVNSGIILKSGNDMTNVYDLINRYKPDMIKLAKWGALYGGALAVMMFDGLQDEDYAKPLNPSQIKGKTMRMYVTDRWYGASIIGTDTVTDMSDLDFGKPMYYNVTYANGTTIKVHHSYCIRYEHRDAPQIIKNGMLQGWGYAEGAHILNELSRDDQLKASIQNLVNKALIEVVKMPGMRGVFMGADQGQMNQLTKRLEMVEWARNYNSLTFLDKEDDYQQNTFSGLTGLADILEDNLWMIGAALEMQGIIYGDLKGGLSQNSDALKRYDYTIHGRCEEFLRNPYTKLITVLFMMCGKTDEKVDFEFGHFALNDINKDKNAGITAFASTLQQLTRNKWISDYRAVISLKTYCETGNMNISFSDEYIKTLEIEEKESILSAMKNGKDKGDKKPGSNGAPMDPDNSDIQDLFNNDEGNNPLEAPADNMSEAPEGEPMDNLEAPEGEPMDEAPIEDLGELE